MVFCQHRRTVTTKILGNPGYQLTSRPLGISSINWGIILTLAGGILWGCAGSVAQWLFESRQIEPEWLVNIRLLFAGSFLLSYQLVLRPTACFTLIRTGKHVLSVAVYGIIGVALCQFSYFKTISLSNAGTACVLQYFSPVLIIVWLTLFYKRIPRCRELIAMLFACTGVFLVSTGGSISELSLDLRTLFWGFISALAVTVYTVQPVKILQHFSAALLLAWGMLIGGITISPLTQWWHKSPQLDLYAVLAISFIIVAGTIAAFTLFMEGMKRIGPTKAGLYACIEPVIATIASAFLLHTSFSFFDILGFLLILLVPFILEIKLGARGKTATQTDTSPLHKEQV